MGYLIIIRGPLGCGKTTISKELTKKLNAKYIAIDEVLKENKLDNIPPGAPCIPVENFIKANEIVIPLAKEYLKNNVVIFDGCFYHKEAIDHLIEKLPFPSYVFTLKAPLELCIERDTKRDRVYGRDAAKAVHSLVSKFDYGTVIDASKDIEGTVSEILSNLSKKGEHVIPTGVEKLKNNFKRSDKLFFNFSTKRRNPLMSEKWLGDLNEIL